MAKAAAWALPSNVSKLYSFTLDKKYDEREMDSSKSFWNPSNPCSLMYESGSWPGSKNTK